ncbi:glycosyltransferase family 4 protein [Kocuria sp. UCD-OTCP]|uniref:glycosyltransferase family 4 protein n=1 Tax=Kocuria sp. UCD-OTCP TaxID=1292021 RepID=UPI0009DA561E|nr:glycosyltransferase family 4 protein [Kocuria sp. UCD-OTCP]
MSPKLTIVGLNFAPEPTGIAPYTTSLASRLAGAGWTVKVITGVPHYPQWRVYAGYTGAHLRASAGEADVLHLRHYVPSAPRLLNRLLMELDFGLKAARVDWGDPDVVLFVSPALFSSGIGLLAARLRRRVPRTAIWIQDLYGRGFQESHAFASALAAPMRWVEAAVVGAADKTFVIHERFQMHVQNHLGVPAKKIEIIRNWSHIVAAPNTDRATTRREFGWKDNEVVVLHAGNMGLKQHLENVVEAARLAEENGSRVRFVLLGSGNQRGHLEAFGAGASRLQFIDPLPDDLYFSALSAADILLVNELPGVREMAVPSKLTSYFITGRPVLASVESESATADEVRSSKAGILVASGNPLALLTAAETLWKNPGTASRLGENGLAYAAMQLSTDKAIRRWDETLRSLKPE